MLTDRQLLILQAIVDDYIRSAEPVGSRSISKREDITFSPATIRNEMADLEELGFLEKPHSSAGRIPSQKGYRYYVDHLLMPHRLTKKERHYIHELFTKRVQEVEQAIQQSAQILSSMTRYISVVLGPEMFETKLKSIHMIPLTAHSVVVIFVTDTGYVENQTMHLPHSVNPVDLEKTVNILNERLAGVSLFQLREKLNKEVADVLRFHVTNYELVLDLLEKTFEAEKSEKVFYGGKTNLLSQPEFRDVEKIKQILTILEQDDVMHQMIRSSGEQIQVRIGHENNVEAFEDLSVITASYSIGGKHMGTIGIVGPTRMEYRRTISVVEHLSKDLTKLLTDLYQQS
ncbi:heat-inducible transcriptional repressor HrcA [Halalkalibacterium halodurans]|uniref:heat-inducible transcriptional repressor HrcA n=1 Tax=Halalkalibacterium halodurans TaxID=86665 RepID=UPI002AA9E337|nr:heat-inducible transcriptional repressor HrcA [Halalkalibacterium halodurans]MDY7221870.1 heat-inducible transcriptional repressor HrcA [Halalkalibacterium halodurans]MDY7241146.1 heat-inducible transcriptional repressor HrcA [Halalkalibacterium halodurans]